MLQNQETAAGLARMADSICGKCSMSQTCQEAPMCGDVQLLKQAEKLLQKD